MNILVVNCGSSSIKYQLIDMDNRSALCSGLVERIGEATGSLTHTRNPGTEQEDRLRETRPFTSHAQGMNRVLGLLTDKEHGVIADLSQIHACGHRGILGGERFTRSVRVDDSVLAVMRELTPLAPLHFPASILGIEALIRLLPHCPSIAVFDTEFHSTMPRHAYLYALPYALYEKHGIRRYGFHGTSHRYVSARAGEFLPDNGAGCNIISCHLGNGCSLCAVRDGVCVDTSMGMTPLAGVIMGTRCGDIDPALHAYLGAQTGKGLEDIDAMLNTNSGLRGVCGMNDMRDIHAARKKGDGKAQLAFAMFLHSIRKTLGGCYAVLGRVDALVFTAGIGENDPLVRAGVCADLTGLGIALDAEKNAARLDQARDISAPDARVRTLVIPTNEELAIAEATLRVLEETR